MARAHEADGLPERFGAFLRARRTADSPYRFGAYRVTTSSRGLVLTRWTPPGTGKTQLGTVVANELLGTTTVLVPGTYVTEHYLTELFDLAADLSPCLILMDDLDLIAGERGRTNPHRLREFLKSWTAAWRTGAGWWSSPPPTTTARWTRPPGDRPGSTP